MKGLNRRLMAGIPSVTPEHAVEVFNASGQLIDMIGADELTHSDFGAVYERLVGLHFEAAGYLVEYRGATLGFYDQGVDLVARKGSEARFIQCKSNTRSLSRQQVEWILYKASEYIDKHTHGPDQFFELVIPSMTRVFPTKPGKQSGKVKSNLSKRQFLLHNQRQKRVRLVITEIPFTCFEPPETDTTPLSNLATTCRDSK
ncbi:restriction endonuclease [Burkholderia gladioli]|uniref:restriction endonuclease n=1 Tax=Burkholderia gladioli TaxID=28095 RepID=UPI0015602852|nr:restriction endonuclease [Burkholderia gladioli]NRF85919.1 restriction endonuclease [Burkholderia gladioli]